MLACASKQPVIDLKPLESAHVLPPALHRCMGVARVSLLECSSKRQKKTHRFDDSSSARAMNYDFDCPKGPQHSANRTARVSKLAVRTHCFTSIDNADLTGSQPRQDCRLERVAILKNYR